MAHGYWYILQKVSLFLVFFSRTTGLFYIKLDAGHIWLESVQVIIWSVILLLKESQ